MMGRSASPSAAGQERFDVQLKTQTCTQRPVHEVRLRELRLSCFALFFRGPPLGGFLAFAFSFGFLDFVGT